MKKHLRDIVGPETPQRVRDAVVGELWADLSVAPDPSSSAAREIQSILAALREDPLLLGEACITDVQPDGTVSLQVVQSRERLPRVHTISGTDHQEMLHPVFQSSGISVQLRNVFSPEQLQAASA